MNNQIITNDHLSKFYLAYKKYGDDYQVAARKSGMPIHIARHLYKMHKAFLASPPMDPQGFIVAVSASNARLQASDKNRRPGRLAKSSVPAAQKLLKSPRYPHAAASIINQPTTEYVGIINHESNCYINVVLQVLFNLEDVEVVTHDCSASCCFTCILRDLFLIYKTGPVLDPYPLVEKVEELKIMGEKKQNDPVEFLVQMIERVNNLPPFGGSEQSKAVCGCGEALTLEESQCQIINLGVSPSLAESFEFKSNSTFSERFCQKCDKRTRHSDVYIYNNLFNHLVIHLSRAEGAEPSRLHVAFPSRLDTMNYKGLESNQGKIYDLHAVVVHHGYEVVSGHYTCFVKHLDEKWIMHNDKEFKHVGIGEVLSAPACALFYKIKVGDKTDNQRNENPEQLQASGKNRRPGRLAKSSVPAAQKLLKSPRYPHAAASIINQPTTEYVGIINHESNCYINVVLQVLFNLEDVEVVTHDCSASCCFTCILRDLFLIYKRGPVLDPYPLVEKVEELKIMGEKKQNDPVEFLVQMIERVNNLPPFGGSEQSKAVCGCGEALTLEESQCQIINLGVSPSLAESFEFKSNSTFSERFCQKCDKRTRHSDVYIYNNLFNHLVIHLSRAEGAEPSRLRVAFPSRLDTMNYKGLESNQGKIYDLHAVVVHHGYEVVSGHYTCFVKHLDEKWIMHNDKEFKHVGIGEVLSAPACVLFYKIKVGDNQISEISNLESFCDFSHVHKKKKSTRHVKKCVSGQQLNALREISKYQNTTDLLIPRTRFHNLAWEIGREYKTDVIIGREASLALQEGAEALVTEMFEDSAICAAHAKRVTIQPKDIELVKKLRFGGWY